MLLLPKKMKSTLSKNQFFKLIRTGYLSRTEKELPVLGRWFPADLCQPSKARFLDIILYSKEQIIEENKSMVQEDPHKDIDYDWGIISVKAQDEDCEIPMEPITALRNALGKEEGGSGVKLNREEYLKSVQFYSKHALVK